MAIKKVRRCYNCGKILQNDNPKEEGFISRDPSALNKEHILFCDKCFEGEKYCPTDFDKSDSRYIEVLKNAIDTNSLIVWVVNLFSFEGQFVNAYVDLLNKAKILIIANKREMLPLNKSDNELKEYVAHRCRASGMINILKDNVIISNNLVDDNAIDLTNRLYEEGNSKDIYIMGFEYSGRATLIHDVLKHFVNASNVPIVTEEIGETNLYGLKIPVKDNHFIISVPSIPSDNSVLNYLNPRTVDLICLRNPVRPRSEILFNGDSLALMNGLVIIELVNGGQCKVDAYFDNNISLKVFRHNSAIQYILKRLRRFRKTFGYDLKDLNSLETYDISVNESNQRDIGIQGLGWINFTGNKQVFRISVPKNVSVYTSRAKLIKENTKKTAMEKFSVVYRANFLLVVFIVLVLTVLVLSTMLILR